MSGIEIAGLVLGAIPLVISALEHYEDIIGPTKAFFKFQGELDHAIRELRVQYTLFEQSMEVLLRPITTDHQLNDMIDNSNSNLWQDPDIEEELRKNLGRAYPSYMSTVDRIQSIMTRIALKFDNINGTENLTRDGLKAIISQHGAAKVGGRLQKFEISRRVKFTMKKKKIKESVEELQKCVDTLDKFQAKADKIAAVDERYNIENEFVLTLHVDVIRENAKKLYDVLSKTWCSTHPSHSAGLLLEQRLIRKPRRGGPGRRHKNSMLSHCDTDCFALSLLQYSASNSKKWLDVEIRVVEYQAPKQNRGPTVRTTLVPPSLSITTEINIDEPPPPYHDPSQLQIVTDLCSILQSPCHPCIGFCLDRDGHLRGSYNAERDVTYVEGGATLQDILTKHPGVFSQQERYHLSITLTLSMLQLSHTPWLQESWSKADIVFLSANNGGPMSRTKVDIKRPYLTREHKQVAPLPHKCNGKPNDRSKVLALGIMLLEIYNGHPIEGLMPQDDLESKNPQSEIAYLQTAHQWIMEKADRGEISFAFLKAISYCLQCFMNPSANLSDPVFSKTIEEQVLAPLEAEMNMLLFGPLSR
ncbi:hypothetical protein TWF718_002321 [Orbilia javanica]|uniref:DUF7580 domain-containing protein n=1 Tax=Orbilia javanica TaxID=47235 RepID=A0AAN8MJX3_9PEZI